MASVVLVSPTGSTETVTDTWTFNVLVFGQGWHPQSGSVESSWQTLLGSGAPVVDPNELIRLSDLQSPTSDATKALQAGYVPFVNASGDTTGAEDVQNINNALSLHPTVWLRGDFTINAPLVIPSNTTVVLADASITLTNGANCNIFRNSDYLGSSGGNTNIRILGLGRALLDGNVATQTDPTNGTWQHVGILLSHVTNYEVGHIQIQKVQNWGISPQHSDDGYIHHIWGDQTGGRYQAIIQATCVRRLIIDTIRGISEDDSVALSAGDGAAITMYADGSSVGDVLDCTIRNVETRHSVENNSNVVRIYAGGGNKLQRVKIEGCRPVASAAGGNTNNVAIGNDGFVTAPPAVGDIKDIEIRNCEAAVFVEQSVSGLTIDGLYYPESFGGGNAISFGGSVAGHTIDDLSIRNLDYNGTTTNWALISFAAGGGNTLTVNRFSLSGVKVNGTFTGSFWYKDAGTTINGIDDGPWRASASFISPPSLTTQGNFQTAFDQIAFYGTVVYNGSNAQNDGAVWSAPQLSPGTWRLDVAGKQGPDGAIVTVDYSTDGGATWTALGTMDQYAASAQVATWTFTGIAVGTTRVLVRFRNLSRNASNTTGWYMRLSAMEWTRTS